MIEDESRWVDKYVEANDPRLSQGRAISIVVDRQPSRSWKSVLTSTRRTMSPRPHRCIFWAVLSFFQRFLRSPIVKWSIRDMQFSMLWLLGQHCSCQPIVCSGSSEDSHHTLSGQDRVGWPIVSWTFSKKRSWVEQNDSGNIYIYKVWPLI